MFSGRSRRVSLALLLASLLAACGPASQYEIKEARLDPVTFTTVDEDSLYLTRPTSILGYGARYLVLLDRFPVHEVWQLDLGTQRARMIGAKGQGPEEYARPNALAMQGDTLWVYDTGSSPRLVEYLLPSGEALGSVRLESRLTSPDIIPVAGLGFYAASLPFEDRHQGLFGLFSPSGELLETFGSFTSYPDYEVPTRVGLERGMNGGHLIELAEGHLLFLYGGRPLALTRIEGTAGFGGIPLDMPWLGPDNRQDANPQYSDVLERLSVKPLIFDAAAFRDGWLVASSDSDTTQVIARYDRTGGLLETIQVPRRADDGYLMRILELGDAVWGLWDTPPFVRRIIW